MENVTGVQPQQQTAVDGPLKVLATLLVPIEIASRNSKAGMHRKLPRLVLAAGGYSDVAVDHGIYFGIMPRQFFDEGDMSPAQFVELVEDLKKLDTPTLSHISAIVRDILSK